MRRRYRPLLLPALPVVPEVNGDVGIGMIRPLRQVGQVSARHQAPDTITKHHRERRVYAAVELEPGVDVKLLAHMVSGTNLIRRVDHVSARRVHRMLTSSQQFRYAGIPGTNIREWGRRTGRATSSTSIRISLHRSEERR